MDNYLVSARKYRPSTFASVVGQKSLTATLKNAVANNRLASSYLFCGSRGVGKTSCARIFAKTINCRHRTPDGEACNECDSCIQFNRGTSMNIIELDAASNNGVDDIRNLVEQVQMAPPHGQYRVFIIDEVHMLSSQAFNAFLKTLEEPPSYVVFILATTEKQKIIPTILSRCQIYDFHRITIQDMIDHLTYVAAQEGIKVEPAALNVIAKKADGAMRDALSIFDQVAASSMGNITYQSAIDNLNVLDYEYYNRLLECFLKNDILGSWTIYKEIRDNGFDSQFFINGLGSYLRDLMVARDPSTAALLEAGEEARRTMSAMAARCTPDFLYRSMSFCNDADLNYRDSSNKQFLIELTLAKICQPVSPSPNKGSNGEGRLKPIAALETKAPAPVTTAPPSPVKSVPPRQQPSVTVPAPTSAPASRPVPVSGHTAPVPPRRGGGGPLKIPSFSIKGAPKESVAQTQTAARIQKRTNPYSEDALLTAWNAYIQTHPKAHILVNTMRAANPTITGPNAFSITVQNDIQLNLMEANRSDIMNFIHDALANDVVDYQVVVNSEAMPRHTLTDSELLEKMTAENPHLRHLIKEFNLHLA